MSIRFAVAAVAILAVCQPAFAQQPKKEAEISLNEVALEINALQTLRQFDFSFAQMEQLQRWAKETAPKESKREPAKTSKEFAEKLRELHKAILDDNDEDRVGQLNEDLDDLREKEKPAVDDNVEITESARKRGQEAYRCLKPAQLATYLGKTLNDTVDPLDRLKSAFEETRALKGNEWRGKRDEIADEMGRLLAGVDQEKADKINDAVAALLLRAHGLDDAKFQKERGELEEAARKIVGNASAGDVLRNQTEVNLAELLSNPRLSAALAARLK